MKRVRIYTDGACSGNPGPGGWAVVVNMDEACKTYFGGVPDTTNNRMELTAIIECTKQIMQIDDRRNIHFDVYSDSAYVIKSIDDWRVWQWKANGWKTKTGDLVKNRDLWEILLGALAALEDVDISFHLIKGHAGNQFNELCDTLARKESLKLRGK